LRYPIDGIETDVQLSRDEVPLLWHDCFMDRMGYPSNRIDDFDYAQLEQMNFSGSFPGGNKSEGAVNLQEFVDSYRGRCNLLIEVKNRDWEEPFRHRIKMRKCLDIIGSVADHEVFISSSNLASLIYANEYSGKAPLYYDYPAREDHNLTDIESLLNEHSFLQGLCVPIEIVNDAIIQRLHRHGKWLITYTCTSAVEIRKAVAMEADVLITDDPHKALRLRGRY
jgi:glycerophosphoryl diester phosphodiesterase